MRRTRILLLGIALSGSLVFSCGFKGAIKDVRAEDSGIVNTDDDQQEDDQQDELLNEGEGDLGSGGEGEEKQDQDIEGGGNQNQEIDGDIGQGQEVQGNVENNQEIQEDLNQGTDIKNGNVQELKLSRGIDYSEIWKHIERKYDEDTQRDILYLFDDNGDPVTEIGFHGKVENKPDDCLVYVIDETGRLATGWLEVDGSTYYFDEWEGEMRRGVFDGYNSVTRRYDKFVANYEGIVATKPGWNNVTLFKGTDIRYIDGEDQEVEVEDKRWFYLYKDHTLYTGWHVIDGKKYYFVPEMCQNEWVIDNDGNKYYFDEKGQITNDPLVLGEDNPWGVIYPDSDGFKDIEEALKVVKQDGKDYVFDDGILLVDTFVEIDDKEVYVKPDGTINYGWYKNRNGKWMYSYKDGSLPEDGWETVGAFKYYFIHGEALSGGTYRFSKEDDSLIDYGGDDFYISSLYDYSDTYELTIRKNAIIANGFVKESDIYSDSDSDRLLYYDKGERYYGWINKGDDWYFIEDSRALCNRYEYLSDYNKADEEDEEELTKNIKYSIEEDRWHNYGFDSTGKLIVNKWYKYTNYGRTEWFYADETGKGMTGWLKWKDQWYYISNGIMLTDSYTPDNYYVDKDGKWDWNWDKYTEFTTNEYGLTVLKDREEQRGWLTGPGGKFYYVAEGYYFLEKYGYGFEDNRNFGVYKNGYYVIPDEDGETSHVYWFSKKGLSVKKPVTKGWKSIGNGNWIYAGDDGIAYTGWVGDYYVENGYMIRDRFLEVTYDEEKKENEYHTIWNIPRELDEESKVNYMFIDNKGKAVKGKYTVPMYNFGYLTAKRVRYDYDNTDYVVFTDEKTGYLIKDKGFYTDAAGDLYYLFSSGITIGARKGQIIEQSYDEKTKTEMILVFQNAGKLATGWVQAGEIKGYLNKDATVYDGMLEDGGNKYFFDRGRLITDSFIAGTKALYAGVDGRIAEKNPFKK